MCLVYDGKDRKHCARAESNHSASRHRQRQSIYQAPALKRHNLQHEGREDGCCEDGNQALDPIGVPYGETHPNNTEGREHPDGCHVRPEGSHAPMLGRR
jgi:hypothetical protein